GEFLGAAKTCSACNRTYNVHSREEITMPTPTAKGKRKPLNPQYKIDAKTAAVKDAGGKLTFDRESRQWVLHLKGKDPIRMTAKEFANETPESIVNRK
ncbi:MAG TPA: hypothetical protein VM531_06880, partial [Sphingomicrobium sp.]|nr:hypothetical protein [Sphingomicrobium sp.]